MTEIEIMPPFRMCSILVGSNTYSFELYFKAINVLSLCLTAAITPAALGA